MIAKLKALNRFEIVKLLVFMCLFSSSLSFARAYMTKSIYYLFLNWNLILALVPYLLTTFLIYSELYSKKSLLIFLFSVWLLFFPNSPYILTDLFHLRHVKTASVWFDLILILSFAWTGLLLGLVSLLDMEEIMRKYVSRIIARNIAVILLFIGSFGVFVGRFLRWNSWDIISQPLELINDLIMNIINPIQNPAIWGMTLLMGVFLNFVYFSIKILGRNIYGSKIDVK